MSVHTNHINNVRTQVGVMFNNWAIISEWLDQYTYENLGSVFTSSDFVVGGPNGDITLAQFIDGIAALQAVKAAIVANGTNLSRLRY